MALLASACGPRDDPNRVDISIIGGPPKLGDPDSETLDATRSILMRETAKGLVTFDAAGQIAPGLAESWIVTDDGRSLIFRIHRFKWPDGREVTGQDVAASLNRAIAAKSANRLKPLLSAIDTVVGMTGRVVEVRLKTPRSYMFQLLAQPELGIRRNGTGLGPWRISERAGNAFVLRPVADPYADTTAEDAPVDKRAVYLRGGRGPLAVARFIHEEADLVLNGTTADWPLVVAADLDGSPRLRRDPVEGLFGFAILPKSDAMKERSIREAMAMAVDRPAIVAALAVPRWPVAERLLPSMLDSGQAPAEPRWTSADMAERRSLAAQRVSGWESARGPIKPLRVAMPAGSGMDMLYARVASDWRRIGVPTVRVTMAENDADLRFVDEVAPNASANWYLTRTGCGYGLACSSAGDAALKEARGAPSLGQRSAAIARADAAFAEASGFIPIAKPLRWSLVRPVLTRYRENMFAAHPFAELRPATKN